MSLIPDVLSILLFLSIHPTLLLCIISLQAQVVSAVYDPNRPHEAENFDPAEADPLGNITCLGESYAINLPAVAGFNPNFVTMQKLCAKPQYNGGLPGQHVGGWCGSTVSSRGPRRRVVFDKSPGAQLNHELSSPRVLLGCLLKCYCNSAETNSIMQPVNTDEAVHNNYQQSTNTYEIKADVVDDFDVPAMQHMGTAPGRWVSAVHVLLMSQIGGPEYGVSPVSMDQHNSIECRGPLPSFPLPIPFRAQHFRNLDELCAVQFFGGNIAANAGGYCHRTALPSNDFARIVWFSDEFTPRADWTWRNFFLSASIRFYCWQHCACTLGPTRENTTTTPSTTKLWAFVKNHEMSHNSDGSYTYQKTGSQQSEGQVLPPQNRLGHSAGVCGADGKQFCNVPWPSDVLGSIPQSPPYGTQVERVSGSENAGVCGSICRGPRDCGSGDSKTNCFCALPSPDDARKLGLDPVATPFVCLALVASSVIGGLGRRDGGRYLDGKGREYRCPCNETFVAPQCCGVRDGVVDLR